MKIFQGKKYVLIVKALFMLLSATLIELFASENNVGVKIYSAVFILIVLSICRKNVKYERFDHIARIVYLLVYCYSILSILSNGIIVISLDKRNIAFFIILSVLNCFQVWKSKGEASKKKQVVFLEYIFAFIVNIMFYFFSFWNVSQSKGWKLAIPFLAIMFIWSLELIRSFELVLKGLSCKKGLFINGNIDTRKAWIIIFLIMTAWGFVLSIIFYPGIITYDNAVMYADAFKLENRNDLHSFFYVMLIRVCMMIWNSYWFLTLLMVLFFSLAWATVMTYLSKKGVKFSAIMGITLFWMFIPSNMYLFISTWKDIPFTICMLLLSYILIKGICENEKLSILDICCLLAGVIGTGVFRSNGLVVILLTTVCCLLIGIKQKFNKRTMSIFTFAAICVFVIRGPLYSIAGVAPTPSGFAALPMLDGIWENLHMGVTLPDSMNDLLVKFEPENGFEDEYREYYMNIGVMPEEYLEIDISEAAKAYMWCLREHPMVTIVARLKKSYNIWGPFSNPVYYEWQNKINSIGDFSSLGVKEKWHFLEQFILFRECILDSYNDNYFIGAILRLVGRCGWNMVIWFCCLLALIEKRKAKCFIAILPAFFNVIALSIGTVSPDYRYTYPMFALSVPFYLYVLLKLRETKEE